MKKSVLSASGMAVVAALLSGCYTTSHISSTPAVVVEPQVQARFVKLSAVGYGAASSFEGYSTGQKRLLAMRASKLDAYRALAEQVYGVRITGNTTVSALVAQNDSFRVYIDAYIRGARVLSVTPMADGNYETVIELDFDEQVVRRYLVQNTVPALPASPSAPISGVRGIVGPGATYGASFYYAE